MQINVFLKVQYEKRYIKNCGYSYLSQFKVKAMLLKNSSICLPWYRVLFYIINQEWVRKVPSLSSYISVKQKQCQWNWEVKTCLTKEQNPLIWRQNTNDCRRFMAKRDSHRHWENSVLFSTHKMQTLSFLGLFSPTILPKLSLLLKCSLWKLSCL